MANDKKNGGVLDGRAFDITLPETMVSTFELLTRGNKDEVRAALRDIGLMLRSDIPLCPAVAEWLGSALERIGTLPEECAGSPKSEKAKKATDSEAIKKREIKELKRIGSVLNLYNNKKRTSFQRQKIDENMVKSAKGGSRDDALDAVARFCPEKNCLVDQASAGEKLKKRSQRAKK